MKTIKKYTLEQLKAVRPVLSEKEQLSIIAGRIEQDGNYYFTRQEMLEMFENETLFPSEFKDKLFEDTEQSTEDHTVYERYWYIPIDEYEKLMSSKFSFSTPQGGGSSSSQGNNKDDKGGMTDDEISITAASMAYNICDCFYSFTAKNARLMGYNVIGQKDFSDKYLSSIKSIIVRILKSEKSNVDYHFSLYQSPRKVSVIISNNYGIIDEIFYCFIK